MDEQRQRDALTDAALDREIASALSVEPSPEYLARVRVRVAAEGAPRSFPYGWIFAGGAVAATLLVVVLLTPGWDSRQTASTAAASRMSDVRLEPQPSAAASAEHASVAPREVVQPVRVRAVARRDDSQRRGPVVLIPEEETRGFALLLERIADEEFKVPPQDEEPWNHIEPVVITPLAALSLSEGELQ